MNKEIIGGDLTTNFRIGSDKLPRKSKDEVDSGIKGIIGSDGGHNGIEITMYCCIEYIDSCTIVSELGLSNLISLNISWRGKYIYVGWIGLHKDRHFEPLSILQKTEGTDFSWSLLELKSFVKGKHWNEIDKTYGSLIKYQIMLQMVFYFDVNQ